MRRVSLVAGYALSALLVYLVLGLVAMLVSAIFYHEPVKYRVIWLVPASRAKNGPR